MVDLQPNYIKRGDGDQSYRTRLGLIIMPDVQDDESWDMIMERGIQHFREWGREGRFSKDLKGYALSYKHTEHEFGKLSQDQANELRQVLTHLVGKGSNKVALWIDSVYMMNEGTGLRDFSSTWVRYGLLPYRNYPVIMLQSKWNTLHVRSKKLSAWLFLEKTLGYGNKGVYTAPNNFHRAKNPLLTVNQALCMWLAEEEKYGFRPSDEIDVRAEIDGRLAEEKARFRCPGKCACIAFMLGRRNKPCGGNSEECKTLASSTNGTVHDNKLILSTAGRIADSVLQITSSSKLQDASSSSRSMSCRKLVRLDLSREQLQEYTKVLSRRNLRFCNIRLFGLEGYQC